MGHLSPAELVDLADGTSPDASVPHLSACERCQATLADLRAAMTAAVSADVPEPSPWFWEQLSARVRERVALEGRPRASWWSFQRVKLPLAAAAAVIAVIADLVTFGPNAHRFDRAAYAPTPSSAVLGTTPDAAVPVVNDPSFNLIADLAGGLDWEAAVAAGVTAGPGAIDHAVSQLNEEERAVLQRLLEEELARTGA